MAKAMETQRKSKASEHVFVYLGVRPGRYRSCICIVRGLAGADAIFHCVFEAFGRPNVRIEDRLYNLTFVQQGSLFTI